MKNPKWNLQNAFHSAGTPIQLACTAKKPFGEGIIHCQKTGNEIHLWQGIVDFVGVDHVVYTTSEEIADKIVEITKRFRVAVLDGLELGIDRLGRRSILVTSLDGVRI